MKNQQTLARLLEFRQTFRSSPDRAESDLALFEQALAQMLRPHKELEQIMQIRQLLRDAVRQERVSNLRDYLLGKSHTLVELIGYLAQQTEYDQAVRKLKPIETKVLMFLRLKGSSTPTQIGSYINRPKNGTSNILRSLRDDGFVEVMQAGKRRWYSLSPVGQKAAADIAKQQQKKSAEEWTKRWAALRKQKHPAHLPQGNGSAQTGYVWVKLLEADGDEALETSITEQYGRREAEIHVYEGEQVLLCH